MFVYMTIETLIDTILVGRPLQHNEIGEPWLDPAHVCRGGTRRGRIAGGRREGNARIHASHVDERAPKPPLTDDPEFLADLSELDRGLIDPAAEAASRPPTRLAPFQGQPARRRLTPEASAALTAASEALAAFDAPADSSISFAPTFGRGCAVRGGRSKCARLGVVAGSRYFDVGSRPCADECSWPYC